MDIMLLTEINVGFWAILPPIIAIVLALITKEVVSSLLVGIVSGALIYAIALGGGFGTVIMDTITTTFEAMNANINFYIIIFLSMLGAIVILVGKSGGAIAYGKWATKKIKTRRASLLSTITLGIMIFIDDYFNCLTIGTVMKPVTDKYQVSHAKLAYVIDSTAAPVCIIAPISSWAAAVGSALLIADPSVEPLVAFIKTVPYNLYAILTLIMVFVVAGFSFDFGKMKQIEENAIKTNDLGDVQQGEEIEIGGKKNGHVYDMILPVVALILFAIFAMLFTGGFFNKGSDGYLDLFQAFGGCDSSLSLVIAGFLALIFTFILYIPRKIVSFSDFMSSITEGAKTMISADIILILAWTISAICGADFLNTGAYVVGLVQKSNMSLAILPAIIFVVAAFLSFSMGTAWGTFTILIPIVVPIFKADAPAILTMALGATLAGSVFGDHCSPISDTTILSSTGSGCNHIQHVQTQIPYCLATASCCFVGYLVGGLCNGNLFATLGAALGSLLLFFMFVKFVLPKINEKRNSK